MYDSWIVIISRLFNISEVCKSVMTLLPNLTCGIPMAFVIGTLSFLKTEILSSILWAVIAVIIYFKNHMFFWMYIFRYARNTNTQPMWPRQVDRWLISKPGYIPNPLLFVYHVHPNLPDGLRNAKYCYFSLTNPGLTVELTQSIWKRYMNKKRFKWSIDVNYFQGTCGRRKLMNSQVDL